MPKEVVRSQDSNDNFELVVKWTPDVHAQIGITTIDGRSLIDILHSDHLRDVGRLMMDKLRSVKELEMTEVEFKVAEVEAAFHEELGRRVLDSVTGARVGYYESVWITPTRSGLNQLIKASRRARNSVHGIDE